MMFSGQMGTFAFSWYMHWFFATLLFMGIVLLIVWMLKNLNKKQLVNWIIILIVAGLLGTLLTMRTSVLGWKWMHSDDLDLQDMMEGAEKMMDGDEAEGG